MKYLLIALVLMGAGCERESMKVEIQDTRGGEPKEVVCPDGNTTTKCYISPLFQMDFNKE